MRPFLSKEHILASSEGTTSRLSQTKDYDLKVTCKPTSEPFSSAMSELASGESNQTIQGGITITSDAEDFPELDISVEGRLQLVPLVSSNLALVGFFSIQSSQCDYTLSYEGQVSFVIDPIKNVIDCAGSSTPICYSNDRTFELDATCTQEDGDYYTMNGTGKIYIEVKGHYDRKHKRLYFEDFVELQEIPVNRCYYDIHEPKTICDTINFPAGFSAPDYDNTHEMCDKPGCEDKWEIDETIGDVTIGGQWGWVLQ